MEYDFRLVIISTRQNSGKLLKSKRLVLFIPSQNARFSAKKRMHFAARFAARNAVPATSMPAARARQFPDDIADKSFGISE
jgi:hypothetical protein